MFSSSATFAQRKKSKKNTPQAQNVKKTGPKPYSKVITKDAVSDIGLFSVHRVDEKHYFELPKDLLNKEILVVSRISGHVNGLNFGGAGMKSRPQQVIRFEQLNEKILMRSVSYNNVAEEGTPIYTSDVNKLVTSRTTDDVSFEYAAILNVLMIGSKLLLITDV